MDDMAHPLITAFLVAIWFFALVLVFFGEWLIGLLPSVARFRRAQRDWGRLTIDRDRIPAPCTLVQISQRRFEELGAIGNDVTVVRRIRDKRFGAMVTATFSKEADLRRAVTEIRLYSLFLILLVCLSGLWIIGRSTDLAFEAIARQLLSQHSVPVLEIVMILVWGTNLYLEIESLKTLTGTIEG
jgi:hypothetical protein